MAVTVNTGNVTIRGVTYKAGSTFVCYAANQGAGDSEGNGSAAALTKGTTYYITGYATGDNGSLTAYPYRIGTSSSVSNTRGWYKENVFPYATFTVTYNANGGSGSMSSSTATYSQAFTTRKNAFTRTGYTFNGWNEKADGTGTAWKLTSAGVYESGKSWTWTYTKNITLYAQWTPSTCTITYNANGGSGAPASQSYEYDDSGATIQLSSTIPTKSGYTFLGWSLSSTATSASYTAGHTWRRDNIGDYTLYAVWGISSYTITYDANGGTGAPADQTKTAGTSIKLSTTKPTKPDTFLTAYTVTYNYNSGTGSPSSDTATTYYSHTFLNWNTRMDGSGTSYSSGATYSTDANLMLFAQYRDNEVGGSVTLPTPTRTNYTFDGWYSNSSLTTKVGNGGASYTPTGNVTLYAKWTSAKYTVTYNANGGTGAPASQTKNHGTNLTLSSTKPSRSNSSTSYTVTYNHNYTGSSNTTATATKTTSYTFKNWNTNSSGTGTSYSSGGTYSTNADVTLYAQWNESSSGGSITLTTPTRNGYTFGGWYSNSSCSSYYRVGDGGASYTPTRNITLYAKWTAVTYTISYNANGGTGAPSSQTKTHGTNLSLSSTKPSRSDSSISYTVTYNHNYTGSTNTSATATTTTSYTFSNWNTNTNGTGTSYSSGATYSTNADATLYAQWTTSSSGGSVTLPTPTRNGYTFGGWYSNSNCSSYYRVGDGGASYTPSKNITLYAKWTGDTYTVSYNANGGTGAPSNQTKTHGTALTLSTVQPTRENYTFKGWATSNTATTAEYQAGGRYTVDSDVTLYAVWELDAVCIIMVYDSNGMARNCLVTVYDSSGMARTCSITPYL